MRHHSGGVPPHDELDPPGDAESVARAICLRLLTVRARTRAELSDALRRRGVPDEAAEPVLNRLTEVGLIDDTAFAAAYARSLHGHRGLARRAVVVKLRQRGVGDDIADAALCGIDADSESAAARDLAHRKMRSLGGLDSAAQTRRLLGLLARRGYSGGLAVRVVREVVTDAETLSIGYPDDNESNDA